MLREITFAQLLEWEAFAELEPFTEEREDYRNAAVVHAIWESARWANSDRHHPYRERPLEQYRLKFGEQAARGFKRTQSWQEQKRIAELLVKAFNAPGRNR